MHVCCAWYHAARRALDRSSELLLRSREDLRIHADRLVATRKTGYNRRFRQMFVDDNPREPFAHVWPILIPGSYLQDLLELKLSGIDWTTTNPHNTFDICLSFYSGITILSITHCSFRTGRELRRITNALGRLTSLSLSNITLQYPEPLSSHVSARCELLHRISLTALDSLSSSNDVLGRGEAVSRAALRHTLATYSSVFSLGVDLSYFPSVLHLLRYLAHFPRLDSLRLSGDVDPDVEIGPTDADSPHTEYTLTRRLSSFALQEVAETPALQLLRLLSTPGARSSLHNLTLGLQFRPSAELLLYLTRLLHLCGRSLKRFWWEVDGDSRIIPPLTANASLKDLVISLNHVPPRLRTIQNIFKTVLSDITSTRLGLLYLNINLDVPEPLQAAIEETFEGADASDSISAFHSILSRSVFDELPTVGYETGYETGVHITVSCNTEDLPSDIEALKPAFISAIKPHVLALFSPWLDRGVLCLWLRPDPHGEGRITRAPTAEKAALDDALVSEDVPKEVGANGNGEST
ncbi:uncharacterized protein C8Q71DRAFT_286751 [Rhodofomes roseus]|uniref:F-box domain-containing protein n=1 Tax=Rhodofomes roseus TaxID=34475 RepID=A0ABQ8K4Q6_9APHY|nr:uncharacterized protein C8Q71DRAFT_286751 [Rhodofomes roseus]KAH9831827.1 hypothetical protein C8Q71DRAFT_286751 [Rhodofomes roseus]